jgi:tetratricopeptide (TPR) repeat protein
VDLSGTTVRIGFGFVFGGQEEEARPRRFRRRREVIVREAPSQEEGTDEAEAPAGDDLPGATGSDQASVEARDRRLAHDELQAQKYPDAERDYRKATQEVPGDYVAWLGLGNALYYQGRQADALAAYQQSLKLHPDAELSALVERLRKPQP